MRITDKNTRNQACYPYDSREKSCFRGLGRIREEIHESIIRNPRPQITKNLKKYR
jgi:hypothetical protein